MDGAGSVPSVRRGVWMGLRIVMMGPPGAGKGTQAGRVARERGLLQISTGEILRDAVKARTGVGVAAKEKMARGELLDDATMIEIVRERVMKATAETGFVLDGFPRTVAQARALDEMMAERGPGSLIVVDVVVPVQELIRRLAGRRICSKCGATIDPFGSGDRCTKCGGELVQRADDERLVVAERLKVHERQVRPVLEFYQERPTFRVVNGAQAPERVASELDAMIDDAAAVGAAVSKQIKAGGAGRERRAQS